MVYFLILICFHRKGAKDAKNYLLFFTAEAQRSQSLLSFYPIGRGRLDKTAHPFGTEKMIVFFAEGSEFFVCGHLSANKKLFFSLRPLRLCGES